jgi:hypothetical protein
MNGPGLGIEEKGVGIPPQSAHMRPDDCQDTGHGDGGIGGRPTLGQDLGSCLGGKGMTGNDGSPVRDPWGHETTSFL